MAKAETVERCIYLISGSYVVKKRGKWSKPFKSIEDARDERDKIETEQAPKPAGGALAKFYHDVYVPNFMANMRANTIKGNSYLYEKMILPYFEDKRINAISHLDCLNFRSHLQSLNKYAPTTINNLITLLSILFNKAKDLDLCDKNPCSKIKKLKVVLKERPTLSIDELINLINDIDHPYKYGIAISALAGARASEVMGFKWEDFEFSDNGKGKISFVRSINKIYELDVLKSDYQAVTLPMNKTLIGFMKEYKEICKDEVWLFQGEVRKYILKLSKYGYKYHRKPHSTPYEYSPGHAISNWWGRLKEKGISIPPDMRFHDLKHTFATNVTQSCSNIKSIQQLCRHANIETTLQIYAHIRPEDLDAEVSNWDW